MDDPVLSVGLDFDSPETATRIEALLRFAEIPTAPVSRASVLLGDNPNGSATNPYVLVGHADGSSDRIIASLPDCITLTRLNDALALATEPITDTDIRWFTSAMQFGPDWAVREHALVWSSEIASDNDMLSQRQYDLIVRALLWVLLTDEVILLREWIGARRLNSTRRTS